MLLFIALLISLINLSLCTGYMCYRDNTFKVNTIICLHHRSLMISTLSVFILTMFCLEVISKEKKSQ
jgi:hypothetical protein